MSSRYASSITRGQKAEERFVRVAEAHGFTVAVSRKNDDIFRHIDYVIVEPTGAGDLRARYVDVKARKRINRNDEGAQDAEIWLEIKNVGGNSGWIYGEGWIAFEIASGFVLVEKQELVTLVNNMVSEEFSDTAAGALYKRYTRSGRKDLLTRVKLEDIVSIGEVWYEKDA